MNDQDVALIREYLEYRDGAAYWKKNTGHQHIVGTRYGHKRPRYRAGKVKQKSFMEHRVVWALCRGPFEKGLVIDHINGDTHDNRIENLRIGTPSENLMNSRMGVRNKSGHKGVSWHRKSGKWQVVVQFYQTQKYLGLYEDFELACLVADEARDLYHGDFARSN